MKLCIDCKHCADLSNCIAPQNMAIDPVTGHLAARWLSRCESHRTGSNVGFLGCRLFGLCGREARWFVHKDAQQ